MHAASFRTAHSASVRLRWRMIKQQLFWCVCGACLMDRWIRHEDAVCLCHFLLPARNATQMSLFILQMKLLVKNFLPLALVRAPSEPGWLHEKLYILCILPAGGRAGREQAWSREYILLSHRVNTFRSKKVTLGSARAVFQSLATLSWRHHQENWMRSLYLLGCKVSP